MPPILMRPRSCDAGDAFLRIASLRSRNDGIGCENQPDVSFNSAHAIGGVDELGPSPRRDRVFRLLKVEGALLLSR